MKRMKRIVAIAMIATMMILLCSCGSPKYSDMAGLWIGEWVYEGAEIKKAIEFTIDGKYGEITFRDGVLSGGEEGTYEIKGRKVFCYENGNKGTYTKYKYKSGKLINNKHAIIKQ